MAREPAGWAVERPEHDVFMRLKVIEEYFETADALKKTIKISMDQSILSDWILHRFVTRGEAQNISSLMELNGRSKYLITRDLNKLSKEKLIIRVGNKWVPSPEFVVGSKTSSAVVNSTLNAADAVRKLEQDRDDNTEEHQARQCLFAERMDQLYTLIPK